MDCFGSNKRFMLQLNYLSQFLQKNYNVSKKCKNKSQIYQPTFSLNWLSEISHDYDNKIQTMDNDLVNFLNNMEENFDNSFVFLFSDHGQRLTSVARTKIGLIEKSMPFFSMHIPKKLSKKYPQLKNIIKKIQTLV